MSSPAALGPGLGSRRRGIKARLKDARISVKLGLILIIPTLAVLALATDRVVQHGQQAQDIQLIESLATLGTNAAAVTQELQHERMTAAKFLATPNAQSDQYLPQIRRTDQAIADYTSLRGALGDVPATVADRLRDVDQLLSILETTRQQVLTRADLTVSAVVLRYGSIAEGLVAYRESLGQVAGDTALGDNLRASAALSRTKFQVAQSQAVAFVALQAGTLDDEQLTSFLSTLIGQQESLDAFMLAATPEQRAFVSSTLTGDAIGLADATANDVIRSTGRPALVTADEAARSLGAVVDLIRWVEERVDTGVLADVATQRNAVIVQVIGEVTAVILVIVIALIIAVVLSRSLVRSLNELRLGALSVANRDLPQTVARLSDRTTIGETTPAEIAAQVADPIDMTTRDEIGDVARAFNVVHREAVRVAAEQAALRTSVSVMFLNLARRSQSLVDQMIAHLDDMERDEADPKRLSRLFRLDHLATRMRRNDENLLVLAGADASPSRNDDVLLADVLRAAQAEIENYDRIEFGSVEIDAQVVARAVNDAVRLLAELLDNATRFSPPDSVVLVSARQIGDYVLIQIEDRGVGISPEQVAFFNTRFAAPPTMDLSAFRMMGLAVVGRLAARYGIQIEMHGLPGEGTTVYIKLPGEIIILRRRGFGQFGFPPPVAPAQLGAPGLPRQRPPVGSADPWSQLGGSATMTADRPDHFNGGMGGHSAYPTSGPPMPTSGPPMPTSGPPMPTSAPPMPSPASGNGHSHRATANDDTAEMPIYREVEAAWFRDSRSSPLADASPLWTSQPGASSSPPPSTAPPSSPSSPPPPPSPPPRSWSTPADEGWRLAQSAADAQARTQTQTGLPKRVPQAQLVPGGVDEEGQAAVAQRNPDNVRGLLSAYHRGVQRGRGVDDQS